MRYASFSNICFVFLVTITIAVVCGACKIGKLIPQFPVTQRAPKTLKTKVDGQMSAARGQFRAALYVVRVVNLLSLDSPWSPALGTSSTAQAVTSLNTSDSSDIEILTHTLGGVEIGN